MSDNYRIDSHKLIFHPHRVACWLDSYKSWEKAKKVYPIYVEISPFGGCNHRCKFCALDYVGYIPNRLDIKLMENMFVEMSALGVKSVMFAGEGEPLLNKEINELIFLAKRAGLDVAITTNGVKIDEKFILQSLDKLTWMKVSFNAGTAKTYSIIHQTNENDFYKVIVNLKQAVKFKKEKKLSTTIGVQTLLLPENLIELEKLITICRDEMKVDYLVVKPYSQHLFSKTKIYSRLNYNEIDYNLLSKKLESYNTEKFQVVFRKNTIKLYKSKNYKRCYATPFFWAYIMSNGDLYSCSAFLGDRRFLIGNIRDGFKNIWEGENRKNNFEMLKNNFDISQCRINCRMEFINNYLYELTDKKTPHVNFI